MNMIMLFISPYIGLWNVGICIAHSNYESLTIFIGLMDMPLHFTFSDTDVTQVV